MPKVRVELTRGHPHRFLRPARLPFRHFGLDTNLPTLKDPLSRLASGTPIQLPRIPLTLTPDAVRPCPRAPAVDRIVLVSHSHPGPPALGYYGLSSGLRSGALIQAIARRGCRVFPLWKYNRPTRCHASLYHRQKIPPPKVALTCQSRVGPGTIAMFRGPPGKLSRIRTSPGLKA